MLTWPKRATSAIVRLFRPIQDVDVYVEDEGDEAFYTCLLGRVKPDAIRLVRVFPLGGRDKVVAAARCHNHADRKALFVIDGDFPWVRGEAELLPAGTYRIAAYCVENLILDELALGNLISEEGGVLLHDACAKLGYEVWRDAHLKPLRDLFVTFAVACELPQSPVTVSGALGRILTTDNDGALPRMDLEKVSSLGAELRAEIVRQLGAPGAAERLLKVERRVEALDDQLKVVSGKDVLLPLADFHVRRCCPDARVKRRSMRMRMAKGVSRERLEELGEALRSVLG